VSAPGTPAPPPDIDDPDGRAAYREELRKVGFWPRSMGMGLILAGFISLAMMKWGGVPPNPRLGVASWAVLAAGWVLFVVAMLMRNRYHRRRLAGV
jgi:hypothetical protein